MVNEIHVHTSDGKIKWKREKEPITGFVIRLGCSMKTGAFIAELSRDFKTYIEGLGFTMKKKSETQTYDHDIVYGYASLLDNMLTLQFYNMAVGKPEMENFTMHNFMIRFEPNMIKDLQGRFLEQADVRCEGEPSLTQEGRLDVLVLYFDLSEAKTIIKTGADASVMFQ